MFVVLLANSLHSIHEVFLYTVCGVVNFPSSNLCTDYNALQNMFCIVYSESL